VGAAASMNPVLSSPCTVSAHMLRKTKVREGEYCKSLYAYHYTNYQPAHLLVVLNDGGASGIVTSLSVAFIVACVCDFCSLGDLQVLGDMC
jgi:hypothetical protein